MLAARSPSCPSSRHSLPLRPPLARGLIPREMLASHLPPAARQPPLGDVPAHLPFYRRSSAAWRLSSPGTGATGARQVRGLARATGPSTSIEWQGEQRPSLHQLGAGGAGVAASATITTKPPQISTPAGRASPPLSAAITGHSGTPLPWPGHSWPVTTR